MALFNHRPLWALVAAAPVMAVISTSTYAQTWKINLRDADLTAFINEVADITGKNFAVDPRVRGNVTVISNKPLTRDEVYDLFLGVLNVNGVVAIPSGNTIKLVPDSNVKNAGLPYDMRNRARGDQVVTRVIWVENTNPNDLIPALRPLMPQFASLAAVPGTNALIVSDRAANIAQLETIIRNLDGTGQNDVEAITLQNSQAEEMVGLLESISSTGASKDVTGSRVRIIADARTNRILIKGDTGTRKRIRNMIETLDVPSADRLGGLKVFRLKYASAKNLAEILQGWSVVRPKIARKVKLGVTQVHLLPLVSIASLVEVHRRVIPRVVITLHLVHRLISIAVIMRTIKTASPVLTIMVSVLSPTVHKMLWWSKQNHN